MSPTDSKARFSVKLLRPANPHADTSWAFVVLPKDASEKLPRRGRTSVEGTINGHPFQATLDPDGQLSHWLKVSKDLQTAAGIKVDDMIELEIAPMEQEPEPEIPIDFKDALESSSEACRVWNATTPIARLDWIHWIDSAKQVKTRAKRIKDACKMLAEGKKRVCCFDPSGYYSKSLSAPEAIR
jgi:hypothetical protein